jgi:hypothetical protein
VRGFEVDVAAKGSKVNATRKGSKVDAMVRSSRSNNSTSIVSTFVARRKMGLNLKFFKITRGGMVNLGNMKWKK